MEIFQVNCKAHSTFYVCDNCYAVLKDNIKLLFSFLFRFTFCMLTCSALSGEFSRTGLNQEVCRVSIIWLPQCICNGQGLRWEEPTRKCSAIGSASYGVSKLLDSSWSTALQDMAIVSWSGHWEMPTAPTPSAGSTQETNTHTRTSRGVHVTRHCAWRPPTKRREGHWTSSLLF